MRYLSWRWEQYIIAIQKSMLFVITAMMSLVIPGQLVEGQSIADSPVIPRNRQLVQERITKSSGDTVTLNVKDSTIGYILRALAKQANRPIVYKSTDAVFSKRMSVRLSNMNLESALAIVLRGTGLTSMIAHDGETIVIQNAVKSEQDRSQPTSMVNGRVVDSATQKGIAGVSVSIVGTKFSATTVNGGPFLLRDVPVGKYGLTVKLFGYKSVTVPIVVSETPATVLPPILLVTIPTSLAEVVTTVTGEQRKLEIGNAITSIKVDSVLKVAPVSSLTDLLEHRVPGLTVLRSSGQPGDPSRLRLRGASSINNSNDMIVVVDGVRVDADPKSFGARSYGQAAGVSSQYLGSSPFDLIDPNSIETIDVFKGPSAAAMYGSDAANGVVVITTKNGRAGPTKITAALTRGLSYLPGTYPEGTYVYGWSQGIWGNEVYGICDQSDPLNRCVVDRVEKFQALNDPHYTVLGHGETESYTLTASGGAPTAQYSVTGSASSEIGLIKMSRYLIDRYQTLRPTEMPGWMRRPDQYRRLAGTGVIASQLKSNMHLRLTSVVSTSEQRKTALGTSAIAVFSQLSQERAILDEQDRFYERANRQSNSTTNTLQWTWMIHDRIRTTATAGYNTTTLVDETMLPAGFRGAHSLEGKGTYSMGRSSNQQKTAVTNMEVPLFRDRLRVVLGGNYNGGTSESFQGSSDSVSAGVTRPTGFTLAGGNSSKISTRGWYIEPRLNIRSKFFIMPGFRIDQNGLSGRNAGGFLLPKLNTSWIASDEDFFPWKDQISLLRLRVAGGVAGTQPVVQDRLRLIAPSDIQGAQDNNAVTYTTLGNTHLQPERSTEFESGIDLDFWNGRAGLIYTYYRKVREDAIERVPVAYSASLGSSEFAQNIGTIQNIGHEFEFRLTPIERGSFAWTTHSAISVNANRVTKLRAGLLPIVRNSDGLNVGDRATLRVVEGYPLWGVWARPLVGYTDTDHNRIITRDEITIADSMAYLGQPDPKGTLSWSNDIRLLGGRLLFNALMSYDWGMLQMASYLSFPNSPLRLSINDPNAALGDQALLQAADITAYPFAQTVNTARLQSLSMNVVLPPEFVKKMKGNSLSVAIQGSNLWMKSNYIGKDPNVGSPLIIGGVSNDVGLIPQPRKWQIRVQWGN